MAQQDAMFTHYMYNTLAVNPAYAGSRNSLTVTGIHRSQWTGFKGAPTTQTLTLHTPLMRPEMGAGLSLYNDKIGPSDFTSVYTDFSYTIKLRYDRKLSFGLKTGIGIFRTELNALNLTEQNDGAFQTNVPSSVLPNVGFGLYYHNGTSYLGVSSPRIMQNNLYGNTGGLNNVSGKLQRHYYIITGTVAKINSRLKCKPTTLIKMTEGAPIEADLTAIFIFSERFQLGAMYRTGDAAGVLLGFFVQPQMELGYSFDWSFGLSSGRYNLGSHEVVLRYDFIYRNRGKIRSPRYF